MGDGYVKIYRSLLDKGYFSQSEYVHLWVYLIMKATYRDREFLFNNKIQELKPGQFITGRQKISKDTGIQESKVERILKCFKSEQQIEQQSFTKFRIITICNWDEYQQIEQQNELPVNNKRTASEQQVNTNKKDKKDKKDKKYILSDDEFLQQLKETYSWVDFNLEIKKMDLWLSNNPTRKKTRRFILNWFGRKEKPITEKIMPQNQISKCGNCGKQITPGKPEPYCDGCLKLRDRPINKSVKELIKSIGKKI